MHAVLLHAYTALQHEAKVVYVLYVDARHVWLTRQEIQWKVGQTLPFCEGAGPWD